MADNTASVICTLPLVLLHVYARVVQLGKFMLNKLQQGTGGQLARDCSWRTSIKTHLNERLDGLLAALTVSISLNSVVLPCQVPPSDRQRQQQVTNPRLVQKPHAQRFHQRPLQAIETGYIIINQHNFCASCHEMALQYSHDCCSNGLLLSVHYLFQDFVASGSVNQTRRSCF